MYVSEQEAAGRVPADQQHFSSQPEVPVTHPPARTGDSSILLTSLTSSSEGLILSGRIPRSHCLRLGHQFINTKLRSLYSNVVCPRRSRSFWQRLRTADQFQMYLHQVCINSTEPTLRLFSRRLLTSLIRRSELNIFLTSGAKQLQRSCPKVSTQTRHCFTAQNLRCSI